MLLEIWSSDSDVSADSGTDGVASATTYWLSIGTAAFSPSLLGNAKTIAMVRLLSKRMATNFISECVVRTELKGELMAKESWFNL